ncbi:DNA/RNA non-specific endonuclease [Exiguobacterium acetylicum]|uniref:DNA/RNA non-specific endonuclease n=1 Tax=Exiguobacterium acetylicum TaxID=41170 RepID=A0ABX8GET5_EXIAC|nr:DNA/RNA non-specific endonuclease [Exiguobacterium acetylicum]QWB31904.1 DNA/RNA non-specific endonuclease [Exiguobacterium acetylicum]
MKISYIAIPLAVLLMAGCTDTETTSPPPDQTEQVTPQDDTTTQKTDAKKDSDQHSEKEVDTSTDKSTTDKNSSMESKTTTPQDSFTGYKKITVDGGDLSGNRQANVVVDIGFGDRKYWAFTNEHGQLIRVIAKKITLQNDATENVTSDGRYYSDEAKVPGVERPDLDEGHIIADSLGGVSNAYNITPQDSTLNRHGDQAYMEDVIRKAGGATNFEAQITYPNTSTMIPSAYQYTYTVRGNTVVDRFKNGNPDETNAALGLTKKKETKTESSATSSADTTATEDVSRVDTDGNGQVTIQEAKEAGYAMPITEKHWLYQYMRDNDHDGMVGE